jgi:putative ubiquitin-RnfH superfamily antitoxin RatB of RatAB toxin-antitoxin module
MDDTLVIAKTLNEHNTKCGVFQKPREYNHKIEPDRCEFLKELLFTPHSNFRRR